MEVTVLLPVYNGLPHLHSAVQSILSQTHREFEFLIIDDCSDDGSRDALGEYNDSRIRVYENAENMRQTRTLNRGLELARGEFIARIDQDDIAHPNRLEMQLRYFKNHPDTAVVGSQLRLINDSGRVIGNSLRPLDDLNIRWYQLFACPIANPAAMFRRSVVWEKLGGYNVDFSLAQDWELWGRIELPHKMANLSEFLLDYRQHDGQQQVKARTVAEKETVRVNRLNHQRILSIEPKESWWERNVDLLRTYPNDLLAPISFMKFLEDLYERFCIIYPTARYDGRVSAELGLQYCLAAERTRSLVSACRAFSLAADCMPTSTLLIRVVRWILISAGARTVRRNLHGFR